MSQAILGTRLKLKSPVYPKSKFNWAGQPQSLAPAGVPVTEPLQGVPFGRKQGPCWVGRQRPQAEGTGDRQLWAVWPLRVWGSVKDGASSGLGRGGGQAEVCLSWTFLAAGRGWAQVGDRVGAVGSEGPGLGEVGEQRSPGGHGADTPGKTLGREGPWGSGMGTGRRRPRGGGSSRGRERAETRGGFRQKPACHRPRRSSKAPGGPLGVGSSGHSQPRREQSWLGWGRPARG